MATQSKAAAAPAMTFDKFLAVLRVERADGTCGPLGDKMAGFQRRFFEAVQPGLHKLAGFGGDGGPRFHWQERHRGGSKSTDVVACLLWLAAFGVRPIRAVLLACDADQGRVMMTIASRIVRQNGWLRQRIEVGQWKLTNPATGAEIEVMSADAASLYGQLVDLIAADEVCLWRDPEQWSAAFSTVGKTAAAMMFCLSNAGWTTHWSWGIREAVRSDPAWRFEAVEGVAPWVDSQTLDSQRRLLTDMAFRRLWRGEWVSQDGDAIEPATLNLATQLAGPVETRETGWAFYAGLDLSYRSDNSAFVVVAAHVGGVVRRRGNEPPRVMSRLQQVLADIGQQVLGRDYSPMPRASEARDEVIEATGRMKLAYVRTWRPAECRGGVIDFGAVQDEVENVHRRLGLRCVVIDAYQAFQMAQNLRRLGITAEAVQTSEQLKDKLAAGLLRGLQDKTLALYFDPHLDRDLRALRCVENHKGLISLDAPRGREGHGDTAVALMLAIRAVHLGKQRQTPRVSRSLVFG